MSILEHSDVDALIELALREDIGSGDVTTHAIFSKSQRARAQIKTRTPTVVCGTSIAAEVFRRIDTELRCHACFVEGAEAAADDVLVTLDGDIRAILSGERCALNFLMRLCGIAHNARRATRELPKDAPARLYDTRKTTPGWRRLEKHAVATGGAYNHRMGLFDAVLIKDNHIAAAGSVSAAVERARAHAPELPIEVEIDDLGQLEEAITSGANIVLLDNFTDAELGEAVQRARGRVELEASGGVTLARIPAIARTGVQRISMGALTHTVTPADLTLEFVA